MTQEKKDLVIKETLNDSQKTRLRDLLSGTFNSDFTDQESKTDLLKYLLITRGFEHFKLTFFNSSDRQLTKSYKEFKEKIVDELKEFLRLNGFYHFHYRNENSGNHHYHMFEIESGFNSENLVSIIDFIDSPLISGDGRVDKMRVENDLAEGFITYNFHLKHFDTPFSRSIQLDSSTLFIKEIVFETNETKQVNSTVKERMRIRRDRKFIFTNKKTSDKLKLIWTGDFICLIDKNLFDKFEVNNQIPSSNWWVHYALKDRLEQIKLLSSVDVINKFKELRTGNYYNDSRLIIAKNRTISKNYELTYFLDKLCSLQNSVNKPVAKHQFVISKTKDLSNEAFGHLSEKSIFKFLSEKFSNLKWYSPSDNLFVDPSVSAIKWLNENNESFGPYDIDVTLGSVRLKIEVKATRSKEETVFYLSIAELEEILKDPEHYIISRVSILQEGQLYNGIIVNSEFYANIFFLTEEAIETITNSIDEWKEHYNENSIRFTTEHLIPVASRIANRLKLELIEQPQLQQELYKEEFASFVDRYFFNDSFRIIESYNFEEDILQYKEGFRKMRADNKFQLMS